MRAPVTCVMCDGPLRLEDNDGHSCHVSSHACIKSLTEQRDHARVMLGAIKA